MIRLKRGLLRWLASTNHKDIEAIIFFLGFVIWIQDISFTTILIAVSTGIKIFRWVRTLQGSKKIIDNNVSLLWIKDFLIMFTLGVLTGIVLLNARIDVVLHDTYYVLAHFHYVLGVGAVFTIFVGVFILIRGRQGTQGQGGTQAQGQGGTQAQGQQGTQGQGEVVRGERWVIEKGKDGAGDRQILIDDDPIWEDIVDPFL